MVHGKNRIPYWIDRRLTGLAGPEYDATISFGLPFESEDCPYGESWVEIFLRKYQPKLIVDPFCGLGTTLVEASTLGIDSFGADISEFNCLLAQVKIAEYDLAARPRII